MAACVSWSARAAARAELRTETIKSIPTHNCYPIQPSHHKHNTTKTLQPTLLFSSWTTTSVTRPPVLCDCSPPEQPSPLETFLLICISFPGFSTNVSRRGLQVGVRCLTTLLQITPHSELWAEKNIWKVRKTEDFRAESSESGLCWVWQNCGSSLQIHENRYWKITWVNLRGWRLLYI